MTWGGYKVNQLDVAASHAGVLMGLTNTIGNIPGLISPLITKLMAKTVSFITFNLTSFIKLNIIAL